MNFTNCENAIGYALRMAERGQRHWWVWNDGLNWRAAGSETDSPGRDVSADRVIAARVEAYVCYPTGLYVPAPQVNWVWWIEEEQQFRQGSAFQAQRYADRKGLTSPIAVNRERLHGSQVRVDYPGRGLYKFVPSRSFPAWAGV